MQLRIKKPENSGLQRGLWGLPNTTQHALTSSIFVLRSSWRWYIDKKLCFVGQNLLLEIEATSLSHKTFVQMHTLIDDRIEGKVSAALLLAFFFCVCYSIFDRLKLWRAPWRIYTNMLKPIDAVQASGPGCSKHGYSVNQRLIPWKRIGFDTA